MFTTKKQPHQKSITTYFKPVGNDQRKRVNATKISASSHPSPTTLQSRQMAMRQINNYRMLRFAGPNAEKISFRFTPEDAKTASETPEWHRHATPPTSTSIDHRRRPSHTQTMARHLDQHWR